MSRPAQHRRRGGFTLLEVMIGSTVLLGVLGAALLAMRSTQGLVSTTTTSALLEDEALRAVETLAADVRWTTLDTFLVTFENGSARLDLRVPEAFVDGEPTWSDVITYRVVPSPVDADENGVLDEGRLVRETGGRTRTLCDDVRPGGFTAQLVGENLRLGLTLARRNESSRALLEAHASTSISVRN